ncbi:hypothetical protein Spa2297_14175 [Streptomyces parvulus]|uniref:Uncharacterized protein n=1 Tax=Streptomyces parvulus TaxID=146923 RepID=A0A191UZD1_9ACTN|nr:hypothetical protein Spa2297_14175 [Streptomyces parvulus]
MASSVETTVTRALARAQGSRAARAATAMLEASPTPPPRATNRAKAARAPGASCCRPCALSAVTFSMILPPCRWPAL